MNGEPRRGYDSFTSAHQNRYPGGRTECVARWAATPVFAVWPLGGRSNSRAMSPGRFVPSTDVSGMDLWPRQNIIGDDKGVRSCG